MKKLQITSAITFVSAWLIGLALAANGPRPSDTAHTIATYFATHEHTAMLAHLLIDGIAGAAVIALAYGLRRYLASDSKLATWMFAAGIAAGITSLVQAAVGETMTYRAAHDASPASIRTLFDVLNNADTVKIAFLAVMIGAASVLARRASTFPRWLATGGLWFAPLLALSGLAFPLASSVLYASLELTLVGLLTWVVASAVVIARRSRRDATPAATFATV
jgi:hypothetical protein